MDMVVENRLFLFKWQKEIIVAHVEDSLQRNQHADGHVMDATFNLGIDAATDIETAQLQFGSNLFLRQFGSMA